MSKIVILIIVAWIVRSVVQSFKKALADAKKELADRAAEMKETRAQGREVPSPSQADDPRQKLLQMLAQAGVSPSVAKVVESALDYDDAAAESPTDYDDAADESGTDYDDDSDEDETDYDDTPPAPPVVWSPPSPPVVPAPPPPPVVYPTPNDATSGTVNQALRAKLAARAKPPPLPRPPVHGLDRQSVKSTVIVRDSVIMDTLLRRYPRNPFFLASRR